MLLVIDLGNTKIKIAVFEQDKIVFKQSQQLEFVEENLEKIFIKYSKINKTIVSSVTNLPENIIFLIKKHSKLFQINQETNFPFENKYATPLTLGIDRKVLVSGGVLRFPNKNLLIIDAGTCITFDFVNSKKEYFGGAISPGIQMRYKALNQFTAKLPLLEKKYPENFIGNSTDESIHSGVVNGILTEMEGVINLYLREFEDLTIILTGGDADFLAKRLKSTIFANSNFLLESLNLLYQYNIK